MTVLITSAQQSPWCHFAEAQLANMGLHGPPDFADGGLTPAQLIDKMSAAYQLSFDMTGTCEQVEPGKPWQFAAAEIFIANADRGAWGWADPRNVFFLDFWRDFDPSCRFLLVYGSPAETLANRLADERDGQPDIEGAVRDWTAFHSALLQFYHANRDRSLLVHVGELERSAGDVTRALRERFEIDTRRVNVSARLEAPAVLQLAAHSLLNGQADDSLLAELDTAADIPRNGAMAPPRLGLKAREEFFSPRQVQALEEDLQALRIENERLKDEQGDLSRKLSGLKAELEASEAERRRLERDGDGLEGLTTENSLLLKQLHQVQEELEHYFKAYQELKAERAGAQATAEPDLPTPAAESKPTKSAVSIDARGFLNGSGWHSAEPQGRWAGPGLSSTVKLPDLAPGAYHVEVSLVDAMTLDIARGVKLALNGQDVPVTYQIASQLSGPLAPARRLRLRLQNVEKPFPMKIVAKIPAHLIAEAGAQPQLELTCPKTVSPADSGGSDTRRLSICVDTISVTRVG